MANVEWGEYRIGDLFEKIKVKPLKYKTSELKKIPDEVYKLPALTAGIENQGLNNYVPMENATILQNVISISANGANTGVTFFQSNKFTVLQDAYAIDWKDPSIEFNRNNGVFISSVINGVLHGKYEWTNKAGWLRSQDEKIYLPTKNGKIDFDFMETFVAELEAQRVAELKNYLEVSGLDDYELSNRELEVIESYDSVEWGEYRIGDLFEIKPTKSYKVTNTDLFDENGHIPVVTNSSANNGITGYTNKPFTEEGNIITYSDTTTADSIFYQPNKFVGYSHIQGLYPINYHDSWNKNSLLFFVSAFRSISRGKFSYGNKFNRKIASEMNATLPLKNGKIDFKFMETYISAITKLAIKDVVKYADKRIATTKKIVNKQ